MGGSIFFFIGTEAEFIKIFPVIIECRKRELPVEIIASGQNDIMSSELMGVICRPDILELSKEKDIKKSTVGLLQWFFRTYRTAGRKIREFYTGVDFKNSFMVVHGDTISTLMGAYLGRKLEMKVAHVEAGLRSHHLLNPFPEEIDRLLTSRKARYHFAPGREPVQNLRKAKGLVVDTKCNTILDSLRVAMQQKNHSETGGEEEPYFVFVLHRQENLMNKKTATDILREIEKVAEHMKCIMIMHEITRVNMEKYGLLQEIENHPGMTPIPRMGYFRFMRLLNGAEFVMTDGGSNQEELHYMGKPCLILRTSTERSEGIGSNAVMYQGDIKNIELFYRTYQEKRVQSAVAGTWSPSSEIVNVLQQEMK